MLNWGGKKQTLQVKFWYKNDLNVFFYVRVTVHHNKFLYNKTNQMYQFLKFTPAWNSTCFGQFLCPSSGVYSLYTRHWYMSYRFEDSFRAGTSVPSVQWINSRWWAEELPETCRGSCRSKIGKFVHLVGFIIQKFECCHLTPFPCAVSDYEVSHLFPSKYLKYSHTLFTPKLARVKPLQQGDRDERSKTAQK